MRVCILATSFPRWRGDYAGHFVFELARHLVQEGVSPLVVAPRGPLPNGEPTRLAEEWDGVSIARFPYSLHRYERFAYGSGIPGNFRAHPLTTLALLPFFTLAFVRAMRRAARGCDLVHANWVFSGLLAAHFLSRLPLVLTVRGSDMNRLPETGVIGWLVRSALKRADAVVAVSPPLAEAAVRRGAPAERVRVIRNGVLLPNQAPARGEATGRVLWVGRMTTEKDLLSLIEAFEIVRRAQPGARLTLVGDGAERPMIEKRASELALDGSVSFEGVVPLEHVGAYYARADVLALSSVAEGTPNVVLEAMAYRLPVVSTAVGGVPHLVRNGENGRLVAPRDHSALAGALLSVTRSAEERDRLGRAARRTVEPLSWKRAAREYKQVFAEVLDSRRSAFAASELIPNQCRGGGQ